MSVCTFIASNCPLAEVAPEKEFDNYFLLPFNDVSDYTDMKYGVYLEWDYTDGRAEQIFSLPSASGHSCRVSPGILHRDSGFDLPGKREILYH